MAAPAEAVRGYLLIKVMEASGKTQRDQFTWDTNNGIFEAFVKVEIRGGPGGPRNVKAQTTKVQLEGDKITWEQDLEMELLEGASELRLMLCREKFQGNKRGTSVIAACGIYVHDILEAVPIDKYFELFKPNAGGEGGYIRISMTFAKDLAELEKRKQDSRGAFTPAAAFAQQPTNTKDIENRLRGVATPGMEGEVAERVANLGNDKDVPVPSEKKKKSGGKAKVLIPLTLLTAGAAVAGGLLLKRR